MMTRFIRPYQAFNDWKCNAGGLTKRMHIFNTHPRSPTQHNLNPWDHSRGCKKRDLRLRSGLERKPQLLIVLRILTRKALKFLIKLDNLSTAQSS